MNDKVKVRLILDVEYDPNGVPPQVLRDMLEYIPQMAASNGLMSGDTEAEVATWVARTVEVEELPANFQEWLLEAVEDGTIELDEDAVIRYGLKEPGELIQEWRERMVVTAAHFVGDEIAMWPGAAEALGPKLREAFGKVLPQAQLDGTIEGGAEQMAMLLCEHRRGDLLRGILLDETLADLESSHPGYGLWDQATEA